MNKQTIRAVISTICICTFVYGSLHLNTKIQCGEKDKEIQILKEEVDNMRTYEGHISALEITLNGKNDTIELLERQVHDIKSSYSEKLKKSELKKYHLKTGVLDEIQLQRADDIAYLVAKHYEEYGVLPSVAVGQAMQETQLGNAYNSATFNYGWWGVCGTAGYERYSTLNEGVMSYLKCLNNGLYDGALFESDPRIALDYIEAGGYCVPSEGYADSVFRCIESYDLRKYDEYYLGF